MKKRFIFIILILLVLVISGCEEWRSGPEKNKDIKKKYLTESELGLTTDLFKAEQIFSVQDLEKNKNLRKYLKGDKSISQYDYVEVTKWADPIRKEPFGYKEYIKEREFFEATLIYSSESENDDLLFLIIDSNLYPYIENELSIFIGDLENDGYNIEMYTVTYGDPEDLRSFLQTAYPSLVGTILIGDISTAWYEIYYDEFPIDYFYMDLNGNWIDEDSNGLFENHTGSVEPEIWVGRIDATTLEGDNIELYKNYFNKNHKYRTSELKLPTRALVYVDNDWAYGSQWEQDHEYLYEYINYVDNHDGTNAFDYQNRLNWDYEWITVMAHSSSGGHIFSSKFEGDEYFDNWVSSNDIMELDPNGLFYNLFACSSARFTEYDYIAGRYLFADTYGLGVVGSTKSGSMLQFGYFYQPLSYGKNLGSAYKDWFDYIATDGFDEGEISWHYGMVLLGDPTLKPNVPNEIPIADINMEDYTEISSLNDIVGTAKKGIEEGSTFDNYKLYIGLGVNPEEWSTNGITVIENGSIEINKNLLGEFDTTKTNEKFNTLKLTVNGSETQTNYRIVIDVNNIYFSDPLNNDFKKSGENIQIIGTVMGTDFSNYTIDYGIGIEPTTWFTEGIILTNGGLNQVIDDVLAVWDTSTILENNFYTLRITRYDVDRFQVTEKIIIFFDLEYLEGWPQKVNFRLVAPSVGVGSIESNNEKHWKIVAGEFKYSEYYTPKQIYLFNYDGKDVPNWPKEIWSQGTRSLSTLANIDEGDSLAIYIGEEFLLWGWNYDGNTFGNWPFEIEPFNSEIYNGPTIGDIDNDNELEIIATTLVLDEIGSYIGVWDKNGNVEDGWPFILINSTIVGSTPAISDVDKDGFLEIFIGSTDKVYGFNHDGTLLPGWPISIDGFIWNSPVIVDINQDGNLDIIFCSDKVYAFNFNGTNVDEDIWPVDISCYIGSPAVGDADGDGDIEIVLSSYLEGDDQIIIINHDGTILPGWPVIAQGTSFTSPILGDIDGDYDIEILISSNINIGRLYAFHHNGSIVNGWPKILPTPIINEHRAIERGTPIISDLDEDGDVDIILGYENYLFVWDLNTPYNSFTMEWPMFQHDPQHTGLYTKPKVPTWTECNTETQPKDCNDVCEDLNTTCIDECTTISGVENAGAEIFIDVNDCSLDYSYESGCFNTIPTGSSRHCCCLLESISEPDFCGDGNCNGNETDINCPEDCGCQAAGCDTFAPGDCYCDSVCVEYGDCCSDACSECGYCPRGGGKKLYQQLSKEPTIFTKILNTIKNILTAKIK
ncbi:MAG: FG-GAP-like repeat-containing protein [Candidatus Woesearchaeota archaeon]